MQLTTNGTGLLISAITTTITARANDRRRAAATIATTMRTIGVLVLQQPSGIQQTQEESRHRTGAT